MSTLSVSTAPPLKPTAPANPFSGRLICGLVGVLLAVLMASINESVTKIAMPDIQGALFITPDEATWLTTLYTAMSVSAMAFTPWFANTFSIRLFASWAIGLFMLFGLLSPFAPNYETLLALRMLQGLTGGSLPPLLMTCALRFLPPNIKLYGLGCYALTATFGPTIATPLAAFWLESFGWAWSFWQAIPFSFLALVFVAYGLPQDPLRLERFQQFNWLGMLLGLPAISMLCTGLLQGERLDWFHSPLITFLLLGSALLMVLFLINEWFHPLPFFKIQLLKNRNLTFALISLGGVLFVLLAASSIPASYLGHIQGYRALQTAPMMLVVSLPQLIALPLVAALCNIPRVDCRWVLALGFIMLAYSCYLGSQLTSEWINRDFYWLQAVQIFAQPMAVIPLLMLSTGKLQPIDGPFASAWFNTVKGFSTVLATAVLGVLARTRLHHHSTSLVDQVGQAQTTEHSALLAQKIHVQASVLSSADLYWLVALVALAFILLIVIMPTRIYPPRAVPQP
ncbi:MFS transporter [Neisseriaceae bacterium CLB008]|nr:MFS transporter [Neisseriaceae bacterium]